MTICIGCRRYDPQTRSCTVRKTEIKEEIVECKKFAERFTNTTLSKTD